MADVQRFVAETITLDAVGPAVDAISGPILVGPYDEVTLTFERDAASTPTLTIYVSNDPALNAWSSAAMTLGSAIDTTVPYVLTGARGKFRRYWFKGVTIGEDKFLKIHVLRWQPF